MNKRIGHRTYLLMYVDVISFLGKLQLADDDRPSMSQITGMNVSFDSATLLHYGEAKIITNSFESYLILSFHIF